MMDQAVEKKLAGFLTTQKLLSLATISEKGTPYSATVTYVSEGTTLYFMTDSRTRKMANIAKNPQISYTVDEDYNADWSKIQGVQMEGKAVVVTDKAELQKIQALLMQKFPQFARMMADMPPNTNAVLVKLIPASGSFLDNSLGFGHRAELKF